MRFISSLSPDRRRWASLFVVCLAQLMIVLDVTIVNVALPAIQQDLDFSPGNLTWVVDAFLITFGSLLLLAGRLGDLAGRKRVFLGGVVLFTFASLLCGIASTEAELIASRFLQGIGAAAQASVILAIIITEFPEAADRARAMSAYVLVSVAGGAPGLLPGGGPPRAPRAPRGRVAHRDPELALGVLRQPPDRGGHLRCRPGGHPLRPRARR